MERQEQKFANLVIDTFGGTTKVAHMTGLTTGRISQWRAEGIPEVWERVLRAENRDAFLLIDKSMQSIDYQRISPDKCPTHSDIPTHRDEDHA